MKRRIPILALMLALVTLLCACAAPSVPQKGNENTPANLQEGNNYKADMENGNNTKESNGRVWPWEDPSITLPPFTGEVTEPGSVKSLKVLAVGDASARDAWYFFPQIAKEAGIEIKIAVLYAAGNLSTHQNENTKYTHYENTGDGWVTVSTEAKKADVLQSEAWDYFIVNQSIANSAKEDGYVVLNDVLGAAKTAVTAQNPNAKVLFMETWVYEANSRNNLFNGLRDFGDTWNKPHGPICALMLEAHQRITKSEVATCTSLSKVATNAKKDGVIPVGTAVHNMRGSYWTDGMTKDGEYLTTTGKTMAALMLFKSLTGYDINGMKLSDPVFDHARPHLGVIKESVNNAYLHPYEVSPSVYDILD